MLLIILSVCAALTATVLYMSLSCVLFRQQTFIPAYSWGQKQHLELQILRSKKDNSKALRNVMYWPTTQSSQKSNHISF